MSSNPQDGRRAFLGLAGAGALLVACHHDDEKKEEDVGAVEDLMREHGIIRRILVVYRESATRLRAAPSNVPADALAKAAKLMRTFGEDYHEKQLEETNLFPVLAKGPLGPLVATLTAQHQRGREITERVLAVAKGTIAKDEADRLAPILESFARMYEEHAAFED